MKPAPIQIKPALNQWLLRIKVAKVCNQDSLLSAAAFLYISYVKFCAFCGFSNFSSFFVFFIFQISMSFYIWCGQLSWGIQARHQPPLCHCLNFCVFLCFSYFIFLNFSYFYVFQQLSYFFCFSYSNLARQGTKRPFATASYENLIRCRQQQPRAFCQFNI